MTDETTPHDLTAASIRWHIDSASPWPNTRNAAIAAREALPFITDDLAADVIEQLLLAAADHDEQLQAARESLSVALGLLHDAQREVARVKRNNVELIERQRAAAVTS